MSKKIIISLHKAQKYITKISKEISLISVNGVGALSIDLSDKAEDVIKEINSGVEEANKKINSFVNLNEDLRKLKSIVFKSNISNGAHELLNDLNLKRKLISVYSGLIHNLKRNEVRNVDSVSVDFINDKIKMARDNGSKIDRINIGFFNKADIEIKVKQIAKEIANMEDKLQSLNVQTIIDIELTDETIELLNLD